MAKGKGRTPKPRKGVTVNIHKNPPPKIAAGQELDVDRWLLGNFWVTVVSSNVRAIKFDTPKGGGQAEAVTGSLFVWFSKGGVYQYHNVPVSVARNMFFADSMGGYVWTYLREQYGYTRLRKG